MKKILIVLAALFLVIILALAGFSYYLYGQLKTFDKEKFVKETAREELKLDVNFKSIGVDIPKLMKLTPALTVKEFTVGSPAGFNSAHMASFEKVSIELALMPLLQKKVKIHSIDIIKPQIFIEQNGAKKLNIDVLMASLEKSSKPKQAPAPKKDKAETKNKKDDPFKDIFKIEKVELDNLNLEKGSLDFIDYFNRSKPMVFRIHDANLRLKDFSLDGSSDLTASLKVLNSKTPNLEYSGKVGPFLANSIPSRGNLSLDFLLSDIPKEVRKQYFGNLILAPQDTDRVTANVNLSGDLMRTMSGSGDIDFKKIRLGKNKKNFVFLAGQTPFSLSANNLLGIPSFSLSVENGVLRVDKGTLNYNKKLSMNNGYFSGSFSGSLQDVEINRFASAFSEFEDEIYGTFEIPNVQLNYAGSDADQILNSLTGEGDIIVRDGRAKILDKILKAKEFAGSALDQLFGKKKKKMPAGEDLSKFTILSTPFEIRNQKFKTSNINLVSPVAKVTGIGNTKFNQTIKYDLVVELFDQFIPVTVRGTTEKPSISVNVKSLFQSEAKDELLNLVEKQFGVGSKPEAQVPETVDPSADTAAPLVKKKGKKKKKQDLFDSLIDLGLEQLQ